MSTQSIPRLKPTPKPSSSPPPGLRLVDVTVTTIDADAKESGARKGVDVARLLAFADAWHSGWEVALNAEVEQHVRALKGLSEWLYLAAAGREAVNDDALFALHDALNLLGALMSASNETAEGLARYRIQATSEPAPSLVTR